MAILEVSNLKKIYTTRFGGNQVQALKNINFSVLCSGRGVVRLSSLIKPSVRRVLAYSYGSGYLALPWRSPVLVRSYLFDVL